jgi:intraflagellar transport protein 80
MKYKVRGKKRGTFTESYLMNNTQQAIMLHVSSFRWERALTLANKLRCHVDTVVGHRQRYLSDTNATETLAAFKEANEHTTVDWQSIAR